MPKLVLFRQKRCDGGVRTGVSLDGATVLMHFAAGDVDDDPALEWFVDIRCEAESLPTTSVKILRWLQENASILKDAIRSAAEKVEVGMDVDSVPYEYVHPKVIGDLQVTVVTNASRRTAGIDLAAAIRDIGINLVEIVRDLEPVSVA